MSANGEYSAAELLRRRVYSVLPGMALCFRLKRSGSGEAGS